MNPNVIIEFTLDGKKARFETSPEKRLLDVLREDAGIKGVKEGCGEGECGACSVLRNGRLVNSCSIPVIAVHGDDILTIEGFSRTESYRIISDSYAEAGAVQCGFCTPGFIMATAALLNENPTPDEGEIRKALSGNLCRCTGYTMIIEAVKSAAARMAGSE
ncbi:MAG: (2Fe-2S)-binding protein [Spirochaetales bacterium]|nr:(2Fe-2S)-binding protein [Spirochaetales bacterium]